MSQVHGECLLLREMMSLKMFLTVSAVKHSSLLVPKSIHSLIGNSKTIPKRIHNYSPSA